MAGALGFEPRSSVLETDSLTVELTPLCETYFVSLWSVCFRHVLQNFENSRRPVVIFLFLVVE